MNSNVELIDVLRSFLRAERQRRRYRDFRDLLDRDQGALWNILANISRDDSLLVFRHSLEQPDALNLDQALQSVLWLGEYGTTRIPLIPFVVGREDDDRRKEVRCWSRREVQLDATWMIEADPRAASALRAAGFNLAAAAPQIADSVCDPLREENCEPIICLERKNADGIGDFQVLDGFHRVVGAVKAGHKSTHAHVGLSGIPGSHLPRMEESA